MPTVSTRAAQQGSSSAHSEAKDNMLRCIQQLKTEDLDLLNEAVQVLCQSPAEALGPLLEAMVSAEEEIRKNAAWVLGLLKANEALRPLFRVMGTDSSVDVRLGAAWALRQFDLRELAQIVFVKLEPPQNLRDIQTYLESKSWKARWFCTVFLTYEQHPELLPQLMHLAQQDENVLVRCSAILTLTAYQGEAVLALLCDLVHDFNDQVKIEAATVLSLKNHQAAVPELLRQLQAYNENVRVAVVAALGALGSTRVVPHLAKVLKDTSALVRINAAMALFDIAQRHKRPHRNLADLCFKALKDENIYVVKNAVRTLGIVGDEDTLREIILLLKQETQPAITANLVQALGMFRDARALKTLAKLLKHENWEVRFEVIGALSQVKGQRKQVYALLLQALKDPSLMVKEQAVRALGALGERKAIVHLEKMKMQHPYGAVNKSIAKALDQLLDF